jgi:hypothetical protein
MQNKAGETVSRAFYAWINPLPFPVGVVVMAEPVYISQTNMDAIKRLPITPPSDVIHEIGTPILYKPGPIFDEEGNPQPCPATKAETAKKAMASIIQPPVPTKEGGMDLDLFFQIVLGTLGTVVVILGVWMGIKLAMGPGSTVMKSLGDSLGRSLAGGYEAIKKVKLPVMPAIPQSVKDSVSKTRRNLGNRLGFGPKGQDPDDILPVLKPEKDIEITNPLFKSKDDFLKFQERNRTRRNINRQKPKKGTIGAITDLPSINLPKPSPGPAPSPAPTPAPAPAPAPPLDDIIDNMKPGITINPIVARRRNARNKRKSSVNSIKNIPEITNAKPLENTPAAISNLPTPPVNPALQELEDIQRGIEKRNKVKSNALRKISANSQARKSQSNAFKDIVNRSRAVDEIDQWDSPAPAPAPKKVSVAKQLNDALNSPTSEDELVPKSEFKTWDRRRQSEYIQKLAKKYNKRLVSSYINVMSQTIGSKPWNPSTKIDSPSRLGKGGRKRRNRRKTGHQLRNRKKTGRKI